MTLRSRYVVSEKTTEILKSVSSLAQKLFILFANNQ